MSTAGSRRTTRGLTGVPLRLALAGLVLTACTASSPRHRAAEALVDARGPRSAEIVWDRWGVPHIYAPDEPALFYAFGWAQMKLHADRILLMYGRARARGAEYWGPAFRTDDEFLRIMDAPRRTADWYERQSPEFRTRLDAFAAGMNAYARAHPDRIVDSVEVVLPVSGADVLAAVQQNMQFTYLTGAGALRSAREQIARGSNGWAIAPKRSASGNAMLLMNPHVPWDPPWVEAHLTAPGIDMYGVGLVGGPVLVIAFNDRLGWTHTVNTVDPVDRFELTLADGGYRFDGRVVQFEQRADTLLVREADGTLRAEVLRIRSTVHGPVLADSGGRAIVDRIAGLDTPGLLEQWWEMGKARNLGEFRRALSRHQLPLLTVMYADRDGHILHHFAAHAPVRSEGDFNRWRFGGILRGDTSATLWTRIHPFEDLPSIMDPPSGYLQNANEAPWLTTLPRALHAHSYPPHMAPRNSFSFRAQGSLRMLESDSSITFDELIAYKHSTRMELADRVVDDLVLAAREHGGPPARRAADVLQSWDRATDADSRGAVLFTAWVREVRAALPGLGFWGARLPLFATQFDPENPLSTPRGLADPREAALALERAVTVVERDYGAIDIPWGELYRLRGEGQDLPANGFSDPYGVFRSTLYARAADGKLVAWGGDSWVAAIEFGDTVRARALLSHGNASQPGSPHRWDQLELYARKELREVWLTRALIEANATGTEVLRVP